jgi:ABC-type nitrate/sulfonate/bicarbonate transport system substrate-binding protein
VEGEVIGQSVLAAWDKAERWVAEEPQRRAAEAEAEEARKEEAETAVSDTEKSEKTKIDA